MKKTWSDIIKEETKQDYFVKLMETIDNLYKTTVVYPPKDELFTCFDLCEYEQTKVVILGQDPYHGEGQAHGLSFSVKKGVKIPPSLRNIYKELESDLGIKQARSGNLSSWAKQGVLLMNTTWSVEEAKPASHKKIGWEIFSRHILEQLNELNDPIVFILWGKHAQEIGHSYITSPHHFILESVHPSPLSASRGFFGTKVFSKTNELLRRAGRKEIDWELEEDQQIMLNI